MEAKTNDTDRQAMRYMSADQKRRARYRRYAKLPVEDLRGEVAAMRVLAQEAWEAGNTNLFSLLTASLGRLARDHVSMMKSTEEYLHRDDARRLAERLCEVVVEAVRGREGYQDVLDGLAENLTVVAESKVKGATDE